MQVITRSAQRRPRKLDELRLAQIEPLAVEWVRALPLAVDHRSALPVPLSALVEQFARAAEVAVDAVAPAAVQGALGDDTRAARAIVLDDVGLPVEALLQAKLGPPAGSWDYRTRRGAYVLDMAGGGAVLRRIEVIDVPAGAHALGGLMEATSC
jgi:hypothetical protein